MPRRSSGPSRSSASKPAPAPARNLPAQTPQQQAPMIAQPVQKQPGLFAQMASTAAGVAVGSAIGHTVGAAITGGMGSSNNQAPQTQQQMESVPQQNQYQQNPCMQQLQQFLECSANQPDLSLCQGFNDVLKDCKLRYGI